MADEYLTVDTEMPNYNGLAREALIPKIGIPIVPTLMVVVVPAILTLFLMPMIGGKAWAIMLFSLPFIGFIYVATKNDSKAMTVYMYMGLWFLRRRNYFLFGKTNTILATKYGQQVNDYVQFFDEINGKTKEQRYYQPKYAEEN